MSENEQNSYEIEYIILEAKIKLKKVTDSAKKK